MWISTPPWLLWLLCLLCLRTGCANRPTSTAEVASALESEVVMGEEVAAALEDEAVMDEEAASALEHEVATDEVGVMAANLATASTLRSATQRFLAELPPAELAAVRGSRLVAGLEVHGVALPKLFEWFVLLSAFGGHGTDQRSVLPQKAAASAATASGGAPASALFAERPPGVLAEVHGSTAGPSRSARPAKAVACAYKLGRGKEWQMRQITLYKGKITYRSVKSCASGVFRMFKIAVEHSKTLDLTELLPGHEAQSLDAQEVPNPKKVMKAGAEWCILVPLRHHDFYACFTDKGTRTSFFSALRRHIEYFVTPPAAQKLLPAKGANDTTHAMEEALKEISGSGLPGMAAAKWEAVRHSLADALADMQCPQNGVDMEKAQRSHEALRRLWEISKKLDSEVSSAAPLSHGDHEAYRRYKLQQTMMDGYFGPSEMNPTRINKLKTLQLKVANLNSKLDGVVKSMKTLTSMDWSQLTRSDSGFVKQQLKGAGRWFLNKLHSVGHAWRSFKKRLSNAQKRCEEEDRRLERVAESRAGVDLSEMKKGVEEGRLPDERGLRDEVLRAERALDGLSGSPEERRQADIEAKEAAKQLRASGERIEARAYEGNSSQGSLLGLAEPHGEAAQKAFERMCQRSRMDEADGLKQSMKQAADPTLQMPHLGIRGMSTQAGFWQRGVEEVVDFRNREIGYFTWQAKFVGASMIGASLGSYTGVGWKGYKLNWTLQEAYQTGIWSSRGISTPYAVAGSAVFVTDADDSGRIWVPDPKGVNAFLLGMSVSVSFNPLGVNYDVGATRARIYTSECFDNLREFLLGIWSMTCSTCDGYESVAVSGLRALTHVVSFPIATELLFTVLALGYRSPQGYHHGCSPISTRYRKDPVHIATSVGRDLLQAIDTLGQIQDSLREFTEDVERDFSDVTGNDLAISRYSPFSSLWRKFRTFTCASMPLTVREQLELEAVGKGGTGDPVEDLSFIQPLSELGLANAQRPFGRCAFDWECPLQHQQCQRAAQSSIRTCRCVPGYCFEFKDGKEVCSEASATLKMLASGIRRWAGAAEIKVGDLAAELESLQGSDLPRHQKGQTEDDKEQV